MKIFLTRCLLLKIILTLSLYVFLGGLKNYAQDGSDLYEYFFSRPLDITTKSDYARIKLYVELNSNSVVGFRVFNILNNYFLFSGVFDTEIEDYEADLVLTLDDSVFSGLKAVFRNYQTGLVLHKDLIKIPQQVSQLEDNIMSFVDKAVFAIDNKKSLFNSAILYSKKLPNGTSDIMLTDFMGKNHYTIIKNGHHNILPVWSNDGTKFMYTTATRYGTKVFVWDFDSFTGYQLIDDTGVTGGSFLSDDQLLITHHITGVPSLHIYYSNIDRLQKLVNTSYINTGGSVNKGRLLYVSNRSGGVQLFLKDLYPANSYQKRMTFIGINNSEPKWSHKGDIFSYTSYFEGRFQIFIMSDDGERFKQLTDSSYNSEQASWSADDRQLIYTHFGPNNSRISFITLDGKFKRQLTSSKNMPPQSHPSWTNNFNWQYLTGFTK